eukprot:scaffold157188_cov35-Tisochrysis_lutea.AAC.1
MFRGATNGWGYLCTVPLTSDFRQASVLQQAQASFLVPPLCLFLIKVAPSRCADGMVQGRGAPV